MRRPWFVSCTFVGWMWWFWKQFHDATNHADVHQRSGNRRRRRRALYLQAGRGLARWQRSDFCDDGGASIFQSATLNTTALKLAWSAPSGAAPAGYYVTSYVLAPTLSGAIGYVSAGRFATAKNSMTIPFIAAGNTYVFLITASVNAGVNIETSPFRSQLPIAHSTVLSAPITIVPGATAN